MNWRNVWYIFITDLTNTLRDRRTWLAMVAAPAIMVPILIIALPTAIEGQLRRLDEAPPKVAVVGSEDASVLVDFLERSGQADVLPMSSEEAQDALQAGDVKAVVKIAPGFDEMISQDERAQIVLEYDASSQISEMTQARLAAVLGAFSQAIVEQRLVARGIDPGLLMPLDVAVQNTASEERVGGFFLAMIMPMMLAVWAALGGMYAAIDGVAGEKERGTLEPLLATPVSRNELVAGKYLTVVLTSVVASVIALLGMYAAFYIKPDALLDSGTGARFSISWVNALLIVGVATLLAGFFGALELALSTFARSFREAQSYLSPLSIAVVIPGVFLQFVDPSEVASVLYMVPLVNGIFVFKEILLNAVDWRHVAMMALSSLVWISLGLKVATNLFRKESVLFRS